MNEYPYQVKELVAQALDEAKAKHGEHFHSLNEFAGVLQEELEELEEAVAQAQDTFRSRLWRDGVRKDDAEEVGEAAGAIRRVCLGAAYEAFQVLAVIEKFEGMEDFEGID